MFKPLLAANWKMNPGSLAAARELARGVKPVAVANAAAVEVVLFPPSLWLLPIGEELSDSGIEVGAQNCWSEPSGAFTGEIAAGMLAECCQWVLLGHSERRRLFGESDQLIATKARAALAAGLKPVICIGENEDEYAAGLTEQVVESSLRDSLQGLNSDMSSALTIAYEPVWAIGTGRNAQPLEVGRVMTLIRRCLDELFEGEAAHIRLLYGGSVKAANASSYTELTDCDGCLVGGASLQVAEFSKMIENVAEKHEVRSL